MGRALVGLLVCGAVSATTATASAAAPPLDLEAADACALVPGADVAPTAGAVLVSAKRFNAPDYTHRRGGATLSVTRTDQALVRKIAALALARL